MNIPKHISELLYRYDCVVVPGFGGFIANHAPARIHPVQHRFHPPSKGISFNRNLTNNDGLLANHIAGKYGLSYEEASGAIKGFVLRINRELKKYGQIEFDEIGTVFSDSHNNLLFEPAKTGNYLLESYGLSSFQAFPVKRKKVEKGKGTVKSESKEPTIHVKEKRSPNLRKYWPAAVALPFIAAAIWIPLKTDLLKNISYSNFNPFENPVPAIYEPAERKIEKPDFTVDRLTAEKLEKAAKGSMHSKIEIGENKTPVIVRLNNKKPVYEATKRNSTNVASESSIHSIKYHVIGGCFAYRDNAEKLVRKLQNKGFDAAIIGKRKGLYTVSFASTNSRDKAMKALRQARTHNPEAWLLH